MANTWDGIEFSRKRPQSGNLDITLAAYLQAFLHRRHPRGPFCTVFYPALYRKSLNHRRASTAAWPKFPNGDKSDLAAEELFPWGRRKSHPGKPQPEAQPAGQPGAQQRAAQSGSQPASQPCQCQPNQATSQGARKKKTAEEFFRQFLKPNKNPLCQATYLGNDASQAKSL